MMDTRTEQARYLMRLEDWRIRFRDAGGLRSEEREIVTSARTYHLVEARPIAFWEYLDRAVEWRLLGNR